MQALFSFATLLLRCVPALFRNRREQAIVELAFANNSPPTPNGGLHHQYVWAEAA